MADRVIQRNDTAARWKEVNPVLARGEIGIETDGAKGYKIGDGVTAWNNLPYPANPASVVLESGTSETAVMSQKVVSEILSELGLEVDYLSNKVNSSMSKSDVESAIDEQISKIEIPTKVSELENDKGYLTEHQDLSGKQDKLVSGINIKNINGQSILGGGNIKISTSNSEQIINTIGFIGSPQVYTCDIKADGLQVFSNVGAIYNAFDLLATLHPKMFKSNGSIGKDASGNYNIKYYTLGKTNPKITTDRVGNNTNQWDDTKYLRKRIFINGNIHSWVERHCCYGLYLFVKELLESDEQWALFIKNNLVLDIVPQPNPWGYDNKTNVNKNNKNLNRYYLTNREPENICIVNLIESLIPRGLIGIIDLHNTNDNTPGYTIGKTSQKYYNELCILASQIESITHKFYKDIYGSDRDSFYHMWNYDSAGINGLLNDYADTKGLICYTSEVGTSIGEKGCIMTKMILVNTINALSNLGFVNNENGDETPDIPIVPDEPSTDPDEPETPDVEIGTDITSLFKWNNGGAIEATTMNKPGEVFSTSLFNYTDYFDVTDYPDFRMSFVKWTSGSGGQPTLGYALYDKNKNYVSGVRFEKADASVGNSAGEVITIDVHITDPSVAYMRTCYPADETKYGEFKAYKIA